MTGQRLKEILFNNVDTDQYGNVTILVNTMAAEVTMDVEDEVERRVEDREQRAASMAGGI